MQHLWQHRLQIRPGMKTVDGRSLQIIDPGRLNTDSGPDFFNAKIRLDGQLWVGNIEIHTRAADWYRHHHDTDPAYHSVILHVVAINDTTITMPDGHTLPQLLLPCNPHFERDYKQIVSTAAHLPLPCHTTLLATTPLIITSWLSAMGHERLITKVDRIIDQLKATSGDWDEVAYTTLARGLGFSTNSDPFERLARSTPLRYIRKHADNTLFIEAMMLGQAGLLDNIPLDNPYAVKLKEEYRFAAIKFQLHPPGIQWKMSRMRPANLPHRRIALLARIVATGTSLMSNIIPIDNHEQATTLFNRPLDGYWQNAYTLAPPTATTPSAPVALSKTSINSLIINVVAPLIYAWGQTRGDFRAMDRAITLLENTPAEHNSLTTAFEQAGIAPHNALDSQALIQVRRNYCEAGKCIYCRIGHTMLRQVATLRSV